MSIFSKIKLFATKEKKKESFSLPEYVVFDLETTGTSLYFSEVIQISAIRVKNGNIVSEFNQYVKPKKAIPQEATNVNHITNEMVKDAPEFKSVYKDFLNFINGSILIGYNISFFDLHILSNQLCRITGHPFSTNYIDLFPVARGIKSVPNHRLTTIAEHFGIETTGAHDALFDCRMTDGCYRNLVQQGFETKVMSFSGKALFRPEWTETTKAINLLRHLMQKITYDHKIDKGELTELGLWIENNQELKGTYPFDEIQNTITLILEDGIIEKSELKVLNQYIEEWLDPVAHAKHTPLGSLKGVHLVLTGDFQYGHKEVVISYAERLGAIVDERVKKTTSYVVVGAMGSKMWVNGNYGNKIREALECRSKRNQKIEIIREADFFTETKSLS